MARGLYCKLALRNLKNNRRVTLPYLLSGAGIILMFYCITALTLGIDEEAMYGGSSVSAMMGFGVFVIALFALLFLFYTNSFLIKRRKKELGLYNILGMEKRHIARVLVIETLLTALCSLTLGLAMGILSSRLLFWALGLVVGAAVPIAFTVPLPAVTGTLVLFGAIYLLTLGYNLLQLKLSRPIELLRGGETGEKEPKAHWVLAVLGALLLGAGYYLALTVQDPLSALLLFFVAVVLVILGTYLLFLTGITALLKLLKKNKRFYYKLNHFTAISGMLYRMKQNAAGLASICILFTALLVTVSTTFSLYTSMDGLLRARYPRNVLVSAYGANQEAKDLIRRNVAETAEHLGLSLEHVIDREGWNITTARVGKELHTQEVPSEAYAVLDIFTEREFERFSGQEVNLSEDQVLLFDPLGTFPAGDTLQIDGNTFAIVPCNYKMPDASTMAQIYEQYYLVFQSGAVVERLLAPSGSNIAPTFSYDFDLAGASAQDIQSFSDALGGQGLLRPRGLLPAAAVGGLVLLPPGLFKPVRRPVLPGAVFGHPVPLRHGADHLLQAGQRGL